MNEILSQNFRTLKEECMSLGTADAEVNPERHAFFLGGNAYYIGKSLHGLSGEEIAAKAKDIKICDTSIDGGKTWVPCLFLRKSGTAVTLNFD